MPQFSAKGNRGISSNCMNYILGQTCQKARTQSYGSKDLIDLRLPSCNDLGLFSCNMGVIFLFVSIQLFENSYDIEVWGGLCGERESASN